MNKCKIVETYNDEEHGYIKLECDSRGAVHDTFFRLQDKVLVGTDWEAEMGEPGTTTITIKRKERRWNFDMMIKEVESALED